MGQDDLTLATLPSQRQLELANSHARLSHELGRVGRRRRAVVVPLRTAHELATRASGGVFLPHLIDYQTLVHGATQFELGAGAEEGLQVAKGGERHGDTVTGGLPRVVDPHGQQMATAKEIHREPELGLGVECLEHPGAWSTRLHGADRGGLIAGEQVPSLDA